MYKLYMYFLIRILHYVNEIISYDYEKNIKTKQSKL
jgi:hypothetical protein